MKEKSLERCTNFGNDLSLVRLLLLLLFQKQLVGFDLSNSIELDFKIRWKTTYFEIVVDFEQFEILINRGKLDEFLKRKVQPCHGCD
jgi:hypothetical protein